MEDRSEDSLDEVEYLDPAQVESASPDQLRKTVYYLNKKYGRVYRDLTIRNAELEELHRMNNAEAANFEMINHGFEVNSEINRIREEYTVKINEMMVMHELELAQMRDKYEHSLKEIEEEMRGQSRQHMINELDEKCCKFIQDIRLKEEELEKTRHDMETAREQDYSSLLLLQEQNLKLKEEISGLKNDQVLKTAKIATLQSQLENDRSRQDQERTRLREEQERTINERVIYEQEKFRKEQERMKEQELRQKGKVATTMEESTRLKNLLEDQKSKSMELERLVVQLREKHSAQVEELERQKNINDNFRQFAEKKETENKRLSEELKRLNDDNMQSKQEKSSKNESLVKEVQRLNIRLRALTEEFQQERQNIEQRCANQHKAKLQDIVKVKQLEMGQLKLDLEVKSREIARLQGKVSEVEMLNKCNVNLLSQKNSLCEKQLEDINKKSKQIRQLQSEVADLREKDQLLDRLNQQNRDKERTIISLEQQLKEGLKRLEKLSQQVKTKERRAAALEQQAEDSKREIERLSGQVTVKEKVAGRYEQSSKEIDRNMTSLAEESRSKTQAIARLELQLRDASEAVEQLKHECSIKQKELAAKDRELGALQLQAKDANSKVQEKSKSLLQLARLNSELENRQKEIRDALEKAKREHDRSIDRVKELELAVRQSEDRIAQQESDLKGTSRSYGEQLQKLTAELQSYESKMREADARQHLLKEELGKSKEKVKLLQKDKASAEKVQEYKDLLQSTTSLNESINEELKKSHRRIAELEQQLGEEKERNRLKSNPMQGKLRDAEKDVMTLQGELSQSKMHLGNLLNEKRFLEIKLEDLRKDRDALAATSKAKLERYEQQVRTRDQNHASDKAYLNEELNKARRLLEDLSNRQTESKLENQMLKGEIESLTKSLALAIDDQKSKNSENDNLKRKIKTLEEQNAKLSASQRIPLQQSFQEKPSSFGEKISEDRNEVVRLRNQSEDRGQEVNRLKLLLQERNAEASRLKQLLEKSQEEKSIEITRLKQEAKLASQRAEDSNKELSIAKKEMENLRRMLQQTDTELANTKLVESKTQQEMERTKVANGSLTRDIADGKREAALQADKIEQLRREKKDLERLLNEAEQTILEEAAKSRRQTNSFQIRQQEDAAKDSLERMQAFCETLRQKGKQEIDRLSTELQQLNSKAIEERKGFEQKLLKAREEAESQLNEVSAKYEQDLKRQRDERIKLKEEMNKLGNERGKLAEQLEQLKGVNSRLARELQIKEDRIGGLQAQIDRTGSQLTAESSAQALLKDQIRKLEVESSDRVKLQGKVAELEAKCRQINEARADAEARMLDQESQLVDASNSLARLKKELASLQKAQAATADQLSSSELTAAQLRGKLQSRQQNKNSELQSVFGQVERLNSMLLEKEREIGDLKTMKSTKLERKRSLEKHPSFAVPQPLPLQPQPQFGTRSGRFEPNREVAKSAQQCWQDLQTRIQAVRQQNERLKNYVGMNPSRQ